MKTPTHRVAVDDLFEELAIFDGLDAFCLLPESDQERFLGWIVSAHDDASYWARIDAIALAMRVGPLQPTIDVGRADITDASEAH